MNTFSLRTPVLAGFLLVALGTPCAHAATYTVTTLSDSGSGSLRAAITRANRASDADTIVFASRLRGVLGLRSSLPSLNSSVSIVGPRREHLNVRRIGIARHRIFTIAKEGIVLLSGLTISNGFSQAVGQTRPENGDGGGIYNEGILQVNNCAITGNQSSGSGGGISSNGPQVTLTNCLITDNKCLQTALDVAGVPSGGGGFYNKCNDAALLITYCTFSRNRCLSQGGAIKNAGDAPVRILRSALTQNTAAKSGGALENIGDVAGEYGGDFIVTESLIANNQAASGGAISTAEYRGKAILTNCTISGNKATERGGAILAGWPGVELNNCTVVNNIAPENAGIWACVASRISQCIIAGNLLPSHAPGTDITLWKPKEMKQPDPSSGSNLIGRGDATTLTYFQKPGDRHNVSLATLKLAPLADNGGPTKTHALLPGSLAIGQGTFDPGIFTDQRGVPRSQGNGKEDIGAFQTVQKSPARPKP